MKNSFFVMLILSLAACGGQDPDGPAPDDPNINSSEMFLTSCDDSRATWLVGMHALCRDSRTQMDVDGIISIRQRDAYCKYLTYPDTIEGVLSTRPPNNIRELITLPGDQVAIHIERWSGTVDAYYLDEKETEGITDLNDVRLNSAPKKFTCSLR